VCEGTNFRLNDASFVPCNKLFYGGVNAACWCVYKGET